MCEPTPTFTIWSLTTSYVTRTLMTSSAVVVTPEAVVSTILTSSCLASSTTEGETPATTSSRQSTQLTATRDVTASATTHRVWDDQASTGTGGRGNDDDDHHDDADDGNEDAPWWDDQELPEQTIGHNALADVVTTSGSKEPMPTDERAPSGLTVAALGVDRAEATLTSTAIPSSAPSRPSTTGSTDSWSAQSNSAFPEWDAGEEAADISRPTQMAKWAMEEWQRLHPALTPITWSEGDGPGPTASFSARVAAETALDPGSSDGRQTKGGHTSPTASTWSTASSLSTALSEPRSSPTISKFESREVTGHDRGKDGSAGDEHDDEAVQEDRRDRTHSARPAFPTAQRENHRARVKRQQCGQWTTITSYSTSFPQPSTSWSTLTRAETTSTVVSVPVETQYASCTPTTPAVAAVVPTGTTRQNPATESYTVEGSPTRVADPAATTASAQGGTSQPSQEASEHDGSAGSSSMFMGTLQDRGADRKGRLQEKTATALAAEDTTSPSVTPKTVSFGGTASPVPSLASTVGASQPDLIPHVTASASGEDATTIQSNGDKSGSTTSKGVSAGAAIGGVAGLLLFLTCILMGLRWYKRRRRKQKTENLRSSWFYGGDVALPDQDGNEKVPSRVRDGHTSGGMDHLQSRFSAPSLLSRHSARLSRAVPAFLALPISHVRNGSAKFPNIIGDVRKSFAFPKARTVVPSWAQRHHANVGLGWEGSSPGPSIPDPPLVHARLDASRHQSIMPFDWEPSWPASRAAEDQLSRDTEEAEEGFSTRSSSNVHGMVGEDGRPLESYYSVYSAQSYHPGVPSQNHASAEESHIGQAVSTPGREPIEASDRSTRPGVTRLPPVDHPDIRCSNTARTLVPAPMIFHMPVPHFGKIGERASAAGQSSLFEYSDCDRLSKRASTATGLSATTRATRDWYDEPMWVDDGEINRLANSLYGALNRHESDATGSMGHGRTMSGSTQASGPAMDGRGDLHDGVGVARKSRKSVRWNDEDAGVPTVL